MIYREGMTIPNGLSLFLGNAGRFGFIFKRTRTYYFAWQYRLRYFWYGWY